MITIKNMARVVRYEAAKAQGADMAKAKTLGYVAVVPLDYAARRAQQNEDAARARVLRRAQEPDW